jgi:Outer membrane protein beta-barrel domain
MHMTVTAGQQRMFRRLLPCAPVVLITSAAAAQTASLSISQGDSVLLPPVASISQPTVTRSEASETKSSAINLSIGNHFSTQLEGSAISVPGVAHPLTNLPIPGDVSATSLMLNGLYEISNGTWHLKPFVGGGFGYVDANARVLGTTNSQWQEAYQLHGGVEVGLAQKLIGSVEYRFTQGILGGLKPTKFNLNSHGVSIGFKYQY